MTERAGCRAGGVCDQSIASSRWIGLSTAITVGSRTHGEHVHRKGASPGGCPRAAFQAAFLRRG